MRRHADLLLPLPRVRPRVTSFRDRVEYTSIVQYYFGRIGYIFSQIGLNGALQSLNIISVIQSAQVMDNAISAIFHHTCALNISPFENPGDNVTVLESVRFWSCQDTNDVSGGNPWGCHVVLSMGYLVALVIALPMGYFNLDDNMVIQVGAFVLTLVCWGLWIVACFLSPTFASGDWAVPAIASGHSWTSQAGVIGTILFNFGFVTTVPSWVNEKKPDVSVNKTVWLSTLICNVVFFIVGIPGAMAFQKCVLRPSLSVPSSEEAPLLTHTRTPHACARIPPHPRADAFRRRPADRTRCMAGTWPGRPLASAPTTPRAPNAGSRLWTSSRGRFGPR